MNMNISILVIGGVLCGIVFFFAGYIFKTRLFGRKFKRTQMTAEDIIKRAEEEAQKRRKEADIEAKALLVKIRTDFETETRSRREELVGMEKRLMKKEENIERKVDILEKKEKDFVMKEQSFQKQQERITDREKELERLLIEEKDRLQRVSRMSAEEAKKLLFKRIEGDIRDEAGLLIKSIEDETKEIAQKKAMNIVSLAIQRCAAEHTVESTVSVVNLPSDEMKGRIIGREGRNIRALETATGIDIIVDDTPEAVILSGFSGVRREIAKMALEKLMSDGRIHPGRIEEVVEKAKKDMGEIICEEGRKLTFDLSIQRIHPEIIKLLGRLKFRTSYGQNVLQHTREVAYLMGVMAGELNLEFALARRIGLLHDIGKAVDHEVQGTHAKLGSSLAKRYGEQGVVINAIEAHHEEAEAGSVYAILVQAADAISAARPGARRETLESYVKRLEKLESIADSFSGVEKTYAIQAGREIRVIVQPDKIGDGEAVILARQITKKVEEGLEYPGQIKVTVIRETRAVEYAK